MQLITMQQAADLMCVTKQYIQQLTARGSLSCYRLGKKAVRYDKDEIIQFIADSRDQKKSNEEKPEEENP